MPCCLKKLSSLEVFNLFVKAIEAEYQKYIKQIVLTSLCNIRQVKINITPV